MPVQEYATGGPPVCTKWRSSPSEPLPACAARTECSPHRPEETRRTNHFLEWVSFFCGFNPLSRQPFPQRARGGRGRPTSRGVPWGCQVKTLSLQGAAGRKGPTSGRPVISHPFARPARRSGPTGGSARQEIASFFPDNSHVIIHGRDDNSPPARRHGWRAAQGRVARPACVSGKAVPGRVGASARPSLIGTSLSCRGPGRGRAGRGSGSGVRRISANRLPGPGSACRRSV